MSKPFTSNAQWPEGLLSGSDFSADSHETLEQAQAVCDMLRRDGLGGEHIHFPVKTWVEWNKHLVKTDP